ncbi:ABC transporter permease [Bacillus sp. V33-4]|uniref:ABC transporter permease n=1 Tax=Bacillus sp. V33-4 TaxID=2054169 RepID=UPI000C77DA05|nr:ABC transporter permease [Bacillus sp. V33-4]PLR80702.1 hypothetical protein CVD23_20440 [Bacillus sp. V33-4]
MKVIFNSMLVTTLRDRITLYYSLLFPIALLIGLDVFFDAQQVMVRMLASVTAISTVFWGMQGIAFQVHWQRSRGVYKLLKLTPMPIGSFIFMMVMARTVLGVAINSIVWFVGVVMIDVDVSLPMVAATFALILAGTVCFTSIGFVLANFARNEAQINMYANMIQIPMIFMSEAFYQLDNAPDWVSAVGNILPFEHYVKALGGVLAGDYEHLMFGLLITGGFMLLALLCSITTFKWENEQQFELRRNAQ